MQGLKRKRVALSAVAVVAIALAVVVRADSPPAPAVDARTEIDRLACLTPDRLAGVRADPHQGVAASYAACEGEVSRKLASLRLTEDQKRVAFVSFLAYALAPYGPSRSVTLEDLLADPAMDCDNYALLTGFFARMFVGESVELKFAGFDGGAVGNHAQLFVGMNGEQLLLDPTIGLVAAIGFDDVLMGKPLPPDRVRIFRQHDDPRIDPFAQKVTAAVLNGDYRPSDMLYYFHTLDQYLKFTDEVGPLWSGERETLLRRYPTPAVAALRKNLGG